MKFERLGNIADIIAGQSPPSSTYNSEGNGIPFFQGKADYGEKYPSVRYWCTEPTKISLPDDILISMRAPVGPVNINTVESCIGRGLSAIRVKKNVSRDFIYFWLKQNQHIIAAKQTGSTFKAITQKILSEIIVPFPAYSDQLHIANILSKAENLIAQRKESIGLLDEFLKSTFLEMFGDPKTNEKGFTIKSLPEFYINPKEGTKCGPFGSALKKEEYTKFGIPVWTMDNILKSGEFNESGCLYVSEEKHKELERYNSLNGDIIISRAGTVGKMCIIKTKAKKSVISSNLIRLRLGKNLLPIYFFSLMRYCQARVIKLKHGNEDAYTHMSTGILDEIKFPYPPIELQTQFAHIVEKTEALKSQYQQSLQELEHLYGSLSQRAFKGELV